MLLYGLVILAVGTALIAAWLEVVAARSKYVQTAEEAIKRRVGIENADALLKQHFYENVLTKNSGEAAEVDLPSGWGSISLGEWTGSPLDPAVASSVTTRNDFNPGGGGGYAVSFPVTLGWGTEEENTILRRYEVHSRSPLLGGQNLVVHRPTTQTNFDPRADLQWQSLDTAAVLDLSEIATTTMNQRANYATTGAPQSHVMDDLAGNDRPVLNYAFPPASFGEAPGTLGYNGTLNVINPTYDAVADNSVANSLRGRAVAASALVVDGSVSLTSSGVTCDGAGNVTIDLGSQFLTNVLIEQNVVTLRLQGQPNFADATVEPYAPLLVVVNDTSNSLETLQMTGQNNRRLVVAIKKPAVANIFDNRVWLDWTSASVGTPGQWRLCLIAENTPLRIASAVRNVVVTGGFMTDAPLLQADVTTTGGYVFVATETDPQTLEEILPKQTWLESYTVYDNL